MKKLLLITAVTLSLAPLAAYAEGEGSGPNFPGLQNPSVAVTTGPAGSYTRQTISSTENPALEGPNSVPQTHTAQSEQTARTWSMIRMNSPG